VPPALGRMRARLDEVGLGATTVRLPLEPELLLPDDRPSGAVVSLLADFGLTTAVISSLPDVTGVTTVRPDPLQDQLAHRQSPLAVVSCRRKVRLA
jgi:acyl-coenzyme A thioesterase PaaI-like protein